MDPGLPYKLMSMVRLQDYTCSSRKSSKFDLEQGEQLERIKYSSSDEKEFQLTSLKIKQNKKTFCLTSH